MFQLDLKSRKSIYEQIIDNIKELIMIGILKEEEKLPSVRELSKILTVNPNTIQKAYRELEHQGYVYTVSGLGCFVSPSQDHKIDHELIEATIKKLKSTLMELRYLGLTNEEILEILKELSEERGDSND